MAAIALLPLFRSSALSKALISRPAITKLISHTGSGVAGWASSKRNLTFYTAAVASSFMLLGSGLLTVVQTSTSASHAFHGFEVLLGIGLGAALISAMLVIKLSAREEEAASAQGFLSQARIIGGNLGLAVATVMMN